MKITKETLKQLIKEELETMDDKAADRPRRGMDQKQWDARRLGGHRTTPGNLQLLAKLLLGYYYEDGSTGRDGAINALKNLKSLAWDNPQALKTLENVLRRIETIVGGPAKGPESLKPDASKMDIMSAADMKLYRLRHLVHRR